MVFHWSLSDSKSPQVSRTLADLNGAIGWMVSTRPVISMSSSPFHNPSVTIPRSSITIGINVTFMFHSSFYSLSRSRYLFFFSLSFNFTLWSARTAKSPILQVLFLLLIMIKSGCLDEIRKSVCMTKSHISLCLILRDSCWVVHIIITIIIIIIVGMVVAVMVLLLLLQVYLRLHTGSYGWRLRNWKTLHCFFKLLYCYTSTTLKQIAITSSWVLLVWTFNLLSKKIALSMQQINLVPNRTIKNWTGLFSGSFF